MREYFLKFVDPDIRARAGRWILINIKAPDPDNGITTNAAESLNNRLREFRKKDNPLKTHIIMLKLKVMDDAYVTDIRRAYYSQVKRNTNLSCRKV